MSNALHLSIPEGLPFIDFEREFDAPVEAVFRAHADPELVAKWTGPEGLTMRIDHWDFRTQGSWAYTSRGPDGVDYGFSGTFHTVRENELAIQTFEFAGYPDVVSIESVRFESLPGGRTKLTGHAVYPTVEARDGMAASDMESGMSQGYDRLEALAAALPVA